MRMTARGALGAIAAVVSLALLAGAACTGARRVAVIVVGHEGHGKATLAAAITRVLSTVGGASFVGYEQLMQQGAAPTITYRTTSARYDHTVCRTHDECMTALKTQRFDAVIVVVSGVDGPMPQTREQVEAARQAGIRDMVIYLNKVDAVIDPDILDLVQRETGELAERYGFMKAETPVIRGSATAALAASDATTGSESIRHLLQAMDSHFRARQQ